MVRIDITVEGELRCTAVHEPSKTTLISDPPVDNQGKGESFSPTDLLATSLGTCMGTYIGIAAAKNGWDLRGTSIVVKKEMVADPLRRIGRLTVDITLPKPMGDKELRILTNAVTTCPVKLSISDRIEVPITFR
jgi:uncharacterized OsmC-like protein